MDKQFVNIDELVRQWLGDGEETERAGAWANMRDVLDREMPQKKRRGGFFFWFNGLALIMLISAISFGGYELTSFIERSNAKTFAGSAYPTTGATASTVTEHSNSRHLHSGARTTAYGYSSADTKETNMGNTSTANNTSNTTGQISITGTTNEIEENTNTNTNANTNTTNTITGTANNKTNTAAVTTSNNQNKSNNNTVSTTTPSNNTVGMTGRNATNANGTTTTASSMKTGIATNSTPASSGMRTTVARTNTASKSTSTAVNTNTNNNSTGTGSGMTATKINKLATPTSRPALASNTASTMTGRELVWNSSSSATASKAQRSPDRSAGATAGSSTSANGASTANNTVGANIPKSKNAKLKLINSDPCNGVTHSITDAVVKKALKTHKQSANTATAASGDATVIARRTRAAKTQTATNATARAKQQTGIAKTTGANKLVVAASTTSPKTVALPQIKLDEAAAKKAAEEEKKDRRHGIKLVLHERLLKNENNETYKKFDTISLEKWEEETSRMMASTAGSNSSSSHSTHNKSGNKTSSGNSNNRNSGANANGAAETSNAEETTEEEAPVLAAAATTPADKAEAPAVKENKESVKPTVSKKSNEPSTMEKLSETFNDIKYHVKGMQFAPGITAGINSTFFGPNSLKGFQFGVTGEFIFSEALSVKSELKYFHRINNNFSIQDEYSTYTAVGGTWRKDQYTQQYGFSTLHSLELPVSVRYTSGKFSFFAGGNAVYSFAVNTGLIGPATLTNSTTVSAVGNDNTPKIQDGDFNSRIGVGYLFGMSFQAAPNLTIDIRNVQTVWDNAPSSGSKYVSGQLFRSPSVQVGVGYRFGGAKQD